MEFLPVVCLCLLSCSGTTSAAGNEPVVEVEVDEGSEAILPCSLSDKRNIEDVVFEWKRDDQKGVFKYDAGVIYNDNTLGPDEQFRGRVSHFEDELKNGVASIKIQNTSRADNGVYTCIFPRFQPTQTFNIKLVVGRVVVNVTEDRDVILPCSVSTDITAEVFDWKKDDQDVFLYDTSNQDGRPGPEFTGRVSHFKDDLKNGNASIIIRNTTVADSGDYTCHFPRRQPRQIFHIRLVVAQVLRDRSKEKIKGVAANPDIDVFPATADWFLLQCEANGTEPLTVEWLDSANNKLQAEKQKISKSRDLLYITVRITVTKTNDYRCVATQTNISHQKNATISVHFQEPVKVVDEDSEAILPCSLSDKRNLEDVVFDWKRDGQRKVFKYDEGRTYNNGLSGQDEQFKGRVSHFEDELKNGNASIKIQNMRLADSGVYTCDFPNLKPKQIFHMKLLVGAAPRPYVKILDQTKDQAVLQCEVHGAFPKPEVVWKDSSGNIITSDAPQVKQSGDRYDIILTTTVTKTGRYRCVVTQKEISHQTESDTYVYFEGPVVVPEDSEAILPCSLSTDITAVLFDWKKNGQDVFLYNTGSPEGQPGPEFTGRVSHFPDELKNGNASIIIRNTKWTDSGNYTCHFPRQQPTQTFNIRLDVDQVLKDRSKENKGAALEPHIKVLAATKHWFLLQCEAHGVAPLTVEWLDGANNTLQAEKRETSERGGQLYITVKINVTKTENYRCVATQKNISHQKVATIPVYVKGPTPPEPGSSAGLVLAGFFGCVSVCAAGFGVHRLYKRHIMKQNGRSPPPATSEMENLNSK